MIVECCICGCHYWKIELFDDKKVKLTCQNCKYIEETEL